MNPARFRPRAQLFVCTNQRRADDPLASGCGVAGPRVYDALKREVARAGRVADTWVTRTGCLGHCPRGGCAVALYPGNEHFIDVDEHDACSLAARAMGATRTG
jgi:predicted metal-binding protein